MFGAVLHATRRILENNRVNSLDLRKGKHLTPDNSTTLQETSGGVTSFCRRRDVAFQEKAEGHSGVPHPSVLRVRVLSLPRDRRTEELLKQLLVSATKFSDRQYLHVP